VATNEQLYYKYTNLANIAANNGGNPQTYLNMAAQYAPAPAPAPKPVATPTPTVTPTPTQTAASVPSGGGSTLPVSGFTAPTISNIVNNTPTVSNTAPKATSNTGGTVVTPATMPSVTSSNQYNFTATPQQNATSSGSVASKSATTVTPTPVKTGTGLDGLGLSGEQITQIMEALAKMGYSPQQPQQQSYTSPYSDQLKKLSDAMLQYYQTPPNLDPSGNQAWQAASKAAQTATSQEFGRRNMLYSDSAKAAINEAAMSLLPQFQETELKRYNQQGSNYMNQLGALTGLENINYGMYRDNVSDTNTRYKNEMDRFKGLYNMASGLYGEDRQQKLDAQNYDMKSALNDSVIKKNEAATKDSISTTSTKEMEARFNGALPPYAKSAVDAYDTRMADPAFRQAITQNWDNLAVIRDQATAAGNNDLALAIEGARLHKMMGDYGLFSEYGVKEFGLTNPDMVKGLAANYISQIKAKYAETMAEVELQKAEQDLQEGNYDAYIKRVQAANIDAKEKQQLVNLGLQAKNIENQIVNRDSANARAESSEQNRQLQTSYNDISKYIDDNMLKISADGTTYELDLSKIESYISRLEQGNIDEQITESLRIKYGV
jgi:hypothetical protein